MARQARSRPRPPARTCCAPVPRFAQLRWSKRIAGKYRWVLYEMWPLEDPVTHRRAVLVCEQNISQVKALEDQFKRQNKR